jgi:VWFA-related protein
MRSLIAILLSWTLICTAQQPGENRPLVDEEPPVIKVRTELVVEAVVVRDKKGNPIPGLTAKDFGVTENGVPQTIRFFEHQELPNATPPPGAGFEPQSVTIYDHLARSRISSDKPGDIRYRDHRLLGLYFDMTAMPPADQLRSLAAAQRFLKTQMTSADMVAILRFTGGSVEVLQDFTGDRNRLLSIVETMIVGEGQGLGESSDDASTSDTGAAFGQDDSEFNVFNTDRQLSALQTAAKMLSQLSEKKSLIYFASGLRLNGVDNQAQLHATIDAAVRGGVSFWPIDARGLVAQAPLGDATLGSQGNIGMYSGAAPMAVTSNFQQSQDSLYALASDTGGKALLDYNDLTKGIIEAEKAVSSY